MSPFGGQIARYLWPCAERRNEGAGRSNGVGSPLALLRRGLGRLALLPLLLEQLLLFGLAGP
jgi:hypothetical protein